MKRELPKKAYKTPLWGFANIVSREKSNTAARAHLSTD
jgi:hypothetical protein